MKRLKKKNHSLLITNIILGALCFFIAFAVTTKVLDRFVPKEIRIVPYIDIQSKTQIKSLYQYCNYIIRINGEISRVNDDFSLSSFDSTTSDKFIKGRKCNICYPVNTSVMTTPVVRNVYFLINELKRSNNIKAVNCDVKEICDGTSISS